MRPRVLRPSLVAASAALAVGLADPAGAAVSAPRVGAPVAAATGCPKDRDCDGVPDIVDRYPDDPSRFGDPPKHDGTAPTASVVLPRKRVGIRTTSIAFRLADPESKLFVGTVQVRRTVRVGTRTREQTYDGRRWKTTSRPGVVDVSKTVRNKARATARVRLKALRPGRYTVVVDISNTIGMVTRKTARFRVR
ncbi:hypothetical protein ACVU7I_10205 [Patulibacter sp. S7RM1-6]